MRGRRPGKCDTRGEILARARELFQEQGYAKTSMRSIARPSNVDPSLMHHYFSCKSELFSECLLGKPTDFVPEEIADEVFQTTPVGELGNKLVLTMITAWESPGVSAAIRANLMSIGEDRLLVSQLQAAIRGIIGGRLAARMGDIDHVNLRASLVISQMVGLAIARYVFVEESDLARMEPQEIAEIMGPTIQRYLVGDVGV